MVLRDLFIILDSVGCFLPALVVDMVETLYIKNIAYAVEVHGRSFAILRTFAIFAI